VRERIDSIVLADALHAGYGAERTAAGAGPVVAEDLAPFVEWARDAAAGKKGFLLTHSEVYPGTFASTTETADHLLSTLELERERVLEWGPGGMQLLGRARRGRFELLSFAGNSAPDHVDHAHGLADWWSRAGIGL
jgi:hypothetical protein